MTGTEVAPNVETIHELIDLRASLCPDATALIFDGEPTSYRQLADWSDQLAWHMAEAGLEPGGIGAVHIERSPLMVAALLGVLKAGATFTMLDPEYPPARLENLLTQVDADLVIHQTKFDGVLSSPHARYLDAEAVEASNGKRAAAPGTAVHPLATAVLMFTSGSTGTPKCVATSHRAVTRTLVGQEFVRTDIAACWLQCAPVSWDAFLLELFTPLFSGGSVVLQPGSRPDLTRIQDLVASHDINTLHLSCSLLNLIIDECPEVFQGVTDVLTGGEPPSSAHIAQLLTRFPDLHVTNGYSPVENTVFALTHRLAPADTDATIPIGRPLHGKAVYLLDANLDVVPPGALGEVYMAGPGLAHGYLGNSVLTAERFIADPSGDPGSRMYRTGDLATQDSEGVFTLAGRADDQVKIRGFRVEPAEIEKAILSFPGIARVAVVVRD